MCVGWPKCGRLCESIDEATFRIAEACAVAASHGAFHLRSLRRLITQGTQDVPTQSTFTFASEHPIIRPVADYGQWLRDALTQPPLEKESA